MVITRTPYRISFFGGGTDYPAWYRRHGGAVLATSIDKYCYLTVRYLPPFFEHRYRVVYSQNEQRKQIAEIQHPAVRVILQEMGFDRGLEIHHDGDLPARSGMGSSSSFAVGLLHALRALRGEKPDKPTLALEAIRIEQECLKETVGSQDQTVAAHGGFNLVRFHPDGAIEVHPVSIPRYRLRELNGNLLLFYTGQARFSSRVAASYLGELATREKQLRHYVEVVEQGVAILDSNRPLREFGELLDEAWKMKRSLSNDISNAEIDQAYEAARRAGACGGKLLGAGGGGFLLVFAEPEKHEAIKGALRHLLEIPFHFENEGTQVIFQHKRPDYAKEDRARLAQKLRPFTEAGPTDGKTQSI